MTEDEQFNHLHDLFAYAMAAAEALGYVPTIETMPEKPLAMRNYGLELKLRPRLVRPEDQEKEQ